MVESIDGQDQTPPVIDVSARAGDSYVTVNEEDRVDSLELRVNGTDPESGIHELGVAFDLEVPCSFSRPGEEFVTWRGLAHIEVKREFQLASTGEALAGARITTRVPASRVYSEACSRNTPWGGLPGLGRKAMFANTLGRFSARACNHVNGCANLTGRIRVDLTAASLD